MNRSVVMAIMILAGVAALAAAPAEANMVLVNDGDFSSWTFDSTGTATETREASNGNPGARLNITTISGSIVYGTGIDGDSATMTALAGLPFEMSLDVLSGPGAFGEGQALHLLVEQNGTIYRRFVGNSSVQSAWDRLTFTGTFKESAFTRLLGPGPANPDLSGGTLTRIGFAGANSISGTLTQYYDNVVVETVPEPATLSLLALGGLALVARRRRA
jgi:hypothetical protein